jgi:SAM-dependent MidA family methyltransferase
MSLADRLIARIRRDGPISVADYMTACLHDPDEGYYATRPRLGAEGDFITAPHVSQMFGELLGLWAVAVWDALGRPPRVRLVEMGPGDGTLMSDVWRACQASPAFVAAQETWLVETSEPLRRAQTGRLGEAGAHWASALAEIPVDAPIILLANELLDCIPIHQAVYANGGWRERRVGVDAQGVLAFTVGGDSAQNPRGGATGDVREWSPALEALGREVAAFVVKAGGAALFIDYGRVSPGPGDTLQALRNHAKEGPLDHPGEADLTAHVDFPAFLTAARDAGAEATPISTQGDFLSGLGIGLRAQRLAAAHPDQAAVIARQVERLIAPEQMGDLFKVAAIHAPGLAPPGLPPWREAS